MAGLILYDGRVEILGLQFGYKIHEEIAIQWTDIDWYNIYNSAQTTQEL